jgi:hypothetical protein
MKHENISEMAGRLAYQKDCEITPTYHDGTKRKAWIELCADRKRTWIKNPTPRGCDIASHVAHNDKRQGK